jgi:pyridoxamine 5'-phosphate oxidase
MILIMIISSFALGKLMSKFRSIGDIRRDYGDLSLNEQSVSDDPLVQFHLWFEEVLEQEQHDPTAMVLSTVDEQGYPDSRVVLLKGIEEGAFVFYTNYKSAKGIQLQHNPHAALNFYWPAMARQVRIRGLVTRVSKEVSDQYFSSRPVNSQLGAIASPQSRPIKDRDFLEQALNQLIKTHEQEPIVRPEHWGGYKLTPDKIEFWQGRDSRLHDRIAYCRQDQAWSHHRLAP